MDNEGSSSPSPPSLFTQQVKWRCNACGVSNEGYLNSCVTCQVARGGSSKMQGFDTSSVWKSLAGQKSSSDWECSMCFIPNDNSRVICEACETPRDGLVSTAKVVSEKPSESAPGPSVSFAAGLFKTAPSFCTTAALFGLPSEKAKNDNSLAPVLGVPEAEPANFKHLSNGFTVKSAVTKNSGAVDLSTSRVGEENMFAKLSQKDEDGAQEIVIFSPSNSRVRSLSSPTLRCHRDSKLLPFQTAQPAQTASTTTQEQKMYAGGLLKRSRAAMLVDTSQPSQESPKYTKRQRTSPPSSPFVSTPQAQSPESGSHFMSSPAQTRQVVDAFFANFVESPRHLKSPFRASFDKGIIGTPLRVDSIPKPVASSVNRTPLYSGFSMPLSSQVLFVHPEDQQQSRSSSNSPNDGDLPANNDNQSSENNREYRFSFGAATEDEQASSQQRRPITALNSATEPCTPDVQTPSFATPNFGSATKEGPSGISEQSLNSVEPTTLKADGVLSTTSTASESKTVVLAVEQDEKTKSVADLPKQEKHELDGSLVDRAAGLVYTWGSGECDQLAVADVHLNSSLAAASPCCIVKLRKQKVIQLACGALHSVALLTDGTVVAWGCNDDYALGRLNDEIPERQPARIKNLPSEDPAVAISCGDTHSACITKNGDCYIWGTYKDTMGYIGFPDYSDGAKKRSIGTKKNHIPTRVPGLVGTAIRLSSGENHTAVLCLEEGSETQKVVSVYVWGSGEFGQLARPPLPDMSDEKPTYLFPFQHTAASLELPGVITNVFCGCATLFLETRLGSDCRYFAVGRNSCGELGIPLEDAVVAVPQEIQSFSGVELHSLSSCQFASIALTRSGEVFTWGKRDYLGRGGVGTAPVDRTPTVVKVFDDSVSSIGTGGDTMFAVTTTGALYSWGEGQMFQIGDGNEYRDAVLEPVLIPKASFGYNGVVEACGGSQHSLALVFNGHYVPKDDELVSPWLLKQRRGEFGGSVLALVEKPTHKPLPSRKRGRIKSSDVLGVTSARLKRGKNVSTKLIPQAATVSEQAEHGTGFLEGFGAERSKVEKNEGDEIAVGGYKPEKGSPLSAPVLRQTLSRKKPAQKRASAKKKAAERGLEKNVKAASTKQKPKPEEVGPHEKQSPLTLRSGQTAETPVNITRPRRARAATAPPPAAKLVTPQKVKSAGTATGATHAVKDAASKKSGGAAHVATASARGRCFPREAAKAAAEKAGTTALKVDKLTVLPGEEKQAKKPTTRGKKGTEKLERAKSTVETHESPVPARRQPSRKARG